MKMLYAGLGANALTPEKLKFNCTRNAQVQANFNVPVNSIGELMLYFELPFMPVSYDVQVVSCTGQVFAVVACYYVVAAHTQGFYGVFSGLKGVVDVHKFYLKFNFYNSQNVAAVFYSQDLEIEECTPVSKIEACYNDASVGANAFDNNGVYYGYPIDNNFLGSNTFRYFHSCYVRMPKIYGTKRKLTLTSFNNSVVYKSNTVKEYNFQSERVPEFYADEILSVLARGFINIDSKGYKVNDEVSLSPDNTDGLNWLMDIPLIENINTYFSCKSSKCVIEDSDICTNNFDAHIELLVIGGVATSLFVSLVNGVLEQGERVELKLFRDDAMIYDNIFNQGETLVMFTHYIPTSCYRAEWRKLCDCNINSALKTSSYNCTQTPDNGAITPILDCNQAVVSFSNSGSNGTNNAWIIDLTLPKAMQAGVTFKITFDAIDEQGNTATIIHNIYAENTTHVRDYDTQNIRYEDTENWTVTKVTIEPTPVNVYQIPDCFKPSTGGGGGGVTSCRKYRLTNSANGATSSYTYDDCSNGQTITAELADGASIEVCSTSQPSPYLPMTIEDLGDCNAVQSNPCRKYSVSSNYRGAAVFYTDCNGATQTQYLDPMATVEICATSYPQVTQGFATVADVGLCS